MSDRERDRAADSLELERLRLAPRRRHEGERGDGGMWVKLDDAFPNHPKIIGLSDRAFRMHIVALCWSAEYGTDGLVPKALARSPVARELIAAGLWEKGDDGYRVHDFLLYNPSAADVEQLRKNHRERMRRWREKRDRRDGDSDV